MRSFALVALGFLSSTIALGACAQGTTFERLDGDGGDGGYGDTSHGSGGYGGYGDTGAGASDTGSGGGSDSGGAGGMGGMGGMGGDGGTGGDGGGGGGTVCNFVSPNTCASAEQLPAVSGDEGGNSSASGTGSKWFKIQVKETDSGIFETDLGYKVTLTSPPGMDYDLYVKQGPQDGSPNCNAAEVKGMLAGGSESVSNSWDDDQGIGGEDDSLWLSIEVRHVSGDNCDSKWSLTVVGSP